ncbi:hypothetical protein ScPMuIL_018583 [Solemya velum]
MDDYKRKQDTKENDEQSMGSLKWTTASLRQIGAIKEKQYDDAFTIQAVTDDLVEIFHYMAGMVPFIQKLIHDKKNSVVLNAKMAHDNLTALKEIKEFMIVNSVPNKNRQKLMRNLRVVELLVSLLKSSFRGTPDQYHMTRIFVEAYDVLYTYLMGDSRKNELYIAKYIDFFLTQFEYKEGKIGLNTAQMVMELIRDNRKIVDRITHTHIDKFVDLLRVDKNYHFLDLLNVLCVCDGVSIADNQKYITEAWLMKGNRNCVYYTDLGNKIGKMKGVVYVSTTNGRTWQELHEFAHKSEEDDYLFLEHQLELFGRLCHGQNEYAIKVITRELNYLTWEEAFTCLKDPRLPDRLRAKYCDLIITMFVDIKENTSVVDRVKLSYIYDDIDNMENLVDKSSSPTYKYFEDLSTWISQFLASNGDMTASESGNNMLVQQVLRLVHYLVSFGFYYKSSDIKKLMEPLMELLDGRNDKPYPNITTKRDKQAEKVLDYFRSVERFQKSPETKAIVDAKCQALEVLNLFFNFIFNLRMEKFMLMFKTTHTAANRPRIPPPELGPLLNETFELLAHPGVVKTALKKLKEIFDETAFLRGYDVVEILKDLAYYEYDVMVRRSMYLLNRFFSAHSNLFKRAVQAQVLITDKSMRIVVRLDVILPTLRRLATSKMTQQQTTELSSILDELSGMCHLEGESEEPHTMNQGILYNNGVLEDAFTILSQEIDVKLLDQYTGLRQIFQKTFQLLKLLARKNKLIQGRLFDRLDMLLMKGGAASELAEALTEVFTGNSNTCMKIMGHQVQKVMSLAAENKAEVPQFLDLLNAVVKVEELDLPLKRNQGYVMTYFMQFRSDVAFVIDQDEAAKEKILTDSTSKDLNYMIALVDLLATCAEGENRFIESICQTIFKISEILHILNNKNVSDNLKRPFLRFFLWVYLNTASGMIESGAGDVPHDKDMWGYLNALNGTIKNVTEFSKNKAKVVKQLLKRPPAKSDRGSDETELLRGTIHYLFDAVMPFLQVFCRSYYQPDQSMYPDEAEDLDNLAKSFKSFMEVIAPLVSIEQQMKNLVSCMSNLLSVSTLPVDYMEEFQDKYGNGFKPQDIRSDARKSYEEYYQQEEEINVHLNIYATNMQLAYGGVNDVQTQIGYPSDAPYSDIGGDEELPLGQEFQEHLACFRAPTPNGKWNYAMAEKLVAQLMISTTLTDLGEKEKLEQIELDIKSLQLLRGLIHNEIVKLPEGWDDDVKSNRRQLKVIEDVQIALNDYGAVISVLNHLSRPQDNIVREVLSFLIVLLFSGNENVQNSIIEYFTGTREETFFFAIKNRMQMSAVATREKRLLYAMHQAKIEESIQQLKSLHQAMKHGTMAADKIVAAQKLGSMLSVARNSMGGRSNMGSRMGLKPGKSPMGSRMMGSRFLSAPKKNVKSNGFEMKTFKSALSLQKGGKSKISPKAPDVDIQIENIDEDELREIMESSMDGTADLDFKDDGFIQLVLKNLGLMCDNQHRGLQNYLREQPDNIKSVNLVAETTRFVNILYSNITNLTIELLVQLFDTLVEYTSGNAVNQSVVFENKICDYLNHILRIGKYKGCEERDVCVMKMSIATLIKALTEENPPEEDIAEGKIQPNLSREIMEYLDTDTLIATMTESFSRLTNNDPMFAEMQELITDVGFAYYHILCRKLDLVEGCVKTEILKTPEQHEAWAYFEFNTLSIEILKDDTLQKIYFRVKDKKVLREEIKDHFKYEVDRTSPSNKLRDFMDWSSDIIHDIKYQRRVHANPIGRLLVKLWLPLNYLVLMISFAISLLMMVAWTDPIKNGMSDVGNPRPVYKYEGAELMTYILGGLHNFLSLCICISFWISNRPQFPSWSNIKNFFISKEDDDDDEFKSWNDKSGESHLEVKVFGFKTIYYLIFLSCSGLGTAFYGYFFAFHLLHIIELNQMLKRVTQAVTTNGRSLLMVALLGLAFFWIYSLIGFAYYREFMLKEDSGRHCRTLYQCFVTLIHHGLVDSPYSTFEGMLDDNFLAALGVAIFDVSFFIIITTIGLNIIFGIIVDTFSQLRDSKWEIDKDMKSNCFICSRESYDFERQGNGFEKHVKEEHNQWAYLFFFIHLDETRPNDYTALELFVYNMLMENKFDFFPMNRALSLMNEEDTNEKKLEFLKQQVEYLVAKMKEEEAFKEREKERQRQQQWEAKHKARK